MAFYFFLACLYDFFELPTNSITCLSFAKSRMIQVRRGLDRAEIYSLSFSPTAQCLAVSSDKGTVSHSHKALGVSQFYCGSFHVVWFIISVIC